MFELKNSLKINNESYTKFSILGYGGTGVAIKIKSEMNSLVLKLPI